MVISQGSISSYSSLITKNNLYPLPDFFRQRMMVQVYQRSDDVQPMPSLAEASGHPLVAPGVGIINFRPQATATEFIGIRPSSRGAQYLLQLFSGQASAPTGWKVLLLQTTSGLTWDANSDLSAILADQVVGNGYPAGGISYTPGSVPAGSNGEASQDSTAQFTATGAIAVNALAYIATVSGTDEFVGYDDVVISIPNGVHIVNINLQCKGIS